MSKDLIALIKDGVTLMFTDGVKTIIPEAVLETTNTNPWSELNLYSLVADGVTYQIIDPDKYKVVWKLTEESVKVYHHEITRLKIGSSLETLIPHLDTVRLTYPDAYIMVVHDHRLVSEQGDRRSDLGKYAVIVFDEDATTVPVTCHSVFSTSQSVEVGVIEKWRYRHHTV